MLGPSPRCTLFPYTTLFRSRARPVTRGEPQGLRLRQGLGLRESGGRLRRKRGRHGRGDGRRRGRSEEHTSELQSLRHLVCRLLLEKKKRKESYSTRW